MKGGLAASALAALSACGRRSDSTDSSSDSSSTTTGGTMKYYINDPVAIDPYNTQESEGTQVESCLFDALTDYDWDKNEVVPLAAESWEANDDNTEFTFHLVQGATFHNGDAVDAASFKRGWERICDSTMATPSEIAYHLDPVVGAKEMQAGEATELSGVEVVDDNTLKVTLTAPMADFPVVCAHPALAPVPQAALDDPASFLLAPIGNGPFKMEGQWVSGQYINVVRYDDYYGTKPNLDGINFSIQKDPTTAFNEYQAGNMDFCQVPTGRLKEIEDSKGTSDDGYNVTPGKQVLTGAEASVYYLCLNLENETMADPNVRHAVSLAINRQNIVDTLFEGSRKPADCIFPSVIDESDENTWEYCHYDKDAAQKIVDDNNLAGTQITLNYNSGGGHEDIMSIVQSDLEAVGFTVTQQSQEWAAYLTSLSQGDFMIGRLGWIADYPTMDNFLYPNFYSTADNNYSKYNNPDIDAGIEAARQISDEEERKSAYRALCKQIGDDCPVVPIMFYAHNHVGSDNVQSFFYDAQGIGDFVHASLKSE